MRSWSERLPVPNISSEGFGRKGFGRGRSARNSGSTRLSLILIFIFDLDFPFSPAEEDGPAALSPRRPPPGGCTVEGMDGRVVLRTERLLVRRWRPEDRAPFAELNADPEVMEHFPSVLTRQESDALLDRIESRMAEDGFGFWALEAAGSGEFVGFTGMAMTRFDAHFTPAPEIGWRLGRAA